MIVMVSIVVVGAILFESGRRTLINRESSYKLYTIHISGK